MDELLLFGFSLILIKVLYLYKNGIFHLIYEGGFDVDLDDSVEFETMDER